MYTCNYNNIKFSPIFYYKYEFQNYGHLKLKQAENNTPSWLFVDFTYDFGQKAFSN